MLSTIHGARYRGTYQGGPPKGDLTKGPTRVKTTIKEKAHEDYSPRTHDRATRSGFRPCKGSKASTKTRILARSDALSWPPTVAQPGKVGKRGGFNPHRARGRRTTRQSPRTARGGLWTFTARQAHTAEGSRRPRAAVAQPGKAHEGLDDKQRACNHPDEPSSPSTATTRCE